MNDSSETNGASSAATLTPPATTRETEAALLACEADLAEAAARGKLRELQSALQRSADLRAWTKEHPWWAVSAAAVAGAAAAVVFLPRRGESIGEGRRTRAPRDDGDGFERAASGGQRSTIWDTLLVSLVGVLKSAAESAILAHLGAKAASDSAADGPPVDVRPEQGGEP